MDQFEPGDRRASSGGETRLLRSSHGADGDYTAMARRARTLWHELEAESGEALVLEPGVAWFAHGEDGWDAASARTLAAQGIPVERLEPDGGRAAVSEPRDRATSRSCCSSPRPASSAPSGRCVR